MSVAEPLPKPVVDEPSTGQWAAFVLLDCVKQSPTVVVFDSREDAEEWCVELIGKIDPGFLVNCETSLEEPAGLVLAEFQDQLCDGDFLHVYQVSDPDSVGGF